jgi:hypothetical protein
LKAPERTAGVSWNAYPKYAEVDLWLTHEVEHVHPARSGRIDSAQTFIHDSSRAPRRPIALVITYVDGWAYRQMGPRRVFEGDGGVSGGLHWQEKAIVLSLAFQEM